jgi:archaeosine-15-forming tRNA-guanine transglycosylase
MGVLRRSFAVFIAVLVGVALAAPAIAKDTWVTISISETAKVANATLPPGDYRVVLDETKATFKRDGKVVAEVTGQWKKEPARQISSGFVRDSQGRILEIHIEGRDTYFAVS